MEHLLQFVWKHKLFPLTPLHTTQGQTVEVIDPGLPNPDAGPDFFNAKIKIDGILWVGNVEIHVHASDWKRHHHHQDRAYDSVILMWLPTSMPKPSAPTAHPSRKWSCTIRPTC